MTAKERILLDLIHEMFTQACWTAKGYDHQCLSTYEEAQRILIKHGIIDVSSCIRKD